MKSHIFRSRYLVYYHRPLRTNAAITTSQQIHRHRPQPIGARLSLAYDPHSHTRLFSQIPGRVSLYIFTSSLASVENYIDQVVSNMKVLSFPLSCPYLSSAEPKRPRNQSSPLAMFSSSSRVRKQRRRPLFTAIVFSLTFPSFCLFHTLSSLSFPYV